jgi:hypothetical protein
VVVAEERSIPGVEEATQRVERLVSSWSSHLHAIDESWVAVVVVDAEMLISTVDLLVEKPSWLSSPSWADRRTP